MNERFLAQTGELESLLYVFLVSFAAVTGSHVTLRVTRCVTTQIAAAREIMCPLDGAIPIGCKSCNSASILMRAAFNSITDCICSARVHARIREQS